MASIDGQRMAEKYLRRTAAAAGDYVEGMQNPRRDPVQAALRAAGKYKDRLMESIREGRWEAGIRAQNHADAVRIATEDGGAAYTSGIAKRATKITQIYVELAPRFEQLSSQIQQMPQDTEAQREQRLLAARKGMIAIGKARRGSATPARA